MEYTTINTILSKFHRDFRDTDINETDAIEWIGEALEFLKVPQIQEQAVTFIEVNNYEANVPKGLQLVLQIARNNEWQEETKDSEIITKETVEEVDNSETCTNDIPYKPYFDMQWQYLNWTQCNYYIQKFTPVRLANHTFFNSLVCKEKSPYENFGEDEYSIVGTVNKKFRFSFEKGQIAISYIKNALDIETGYPLIPDNISYITAITYYIKWKMAERLAWDGRESYARLAQDSERLWLKYARQGKNFMKMPKTIDQFQNLLEQSHYLIPRHKRYYNFFGNLGREEDRKFNDPDYRNKSYRNFGINININN